MKQITKRKIPHAWVNGISDDRKKTCVLTCSTGNKLIIEMVSEKIFATKVFIIIIEIARMIQNYLLFQIFVSILAEEL